MISKRRNRYLGPSSTNARKCEEDEEAGRGEMRRETRKGTWLCEQSRGGVKGVPKPSTRGNGKGSRVSRGTVHGILTQTRRIEK